jgi:DNA-binding NarL/FixJ family response regulator
MTSGTLVRVVTADVQPIFRAGVKQILAAYPDIVVVGEAGTSLDAYALCERLCPDVLLLDPTMPGGLAVLGRIFERRLPTRVVILTDHVDSGLLSRALQFGAAGYLLKQIAAFDFAHAVRSAAGGLLTLSPEASAVAFSDSEAEPGPDELSEREQAVLDLLLYGLSNRAIAARLHLSCATVKFHLGNIYTKLGVRTRSEALALFYRQQHGLAGLSAGREPALLVTRPLFAVS